jgi:Stress responsive A/B Barrel Domain
LTARTFSRRLALTTPVMVAAGFAPGSASADACDLSPVIKHTVAFRYQPNVTQQQKGDVMNRFLALKQECKRDGNYYIVSLVGGDCTNSLEGLTEGFEQAYIVTFKDHDDYKYYIGQPFSYPFDPAHDAFKKFAIPLLSVDENGKTDGAIALDFSTAVSPENC